MARSLKPVITIETEALWFDEVRETFSEKVMAGNAVICPCCDRHNMICKRKITSVMARQLLMMRKEPSREFESTELQAEVSGDWRLYSLLKFWGFIEPTEGAFWRITPQGIAFVDGEIDAPKIALVLNNKCVGFIHRDRITFKEAAKDWFDLSEVFSATEADIKSRDPAFDSEFV